MTMTAKKKVGAALGSAAVVAAAIALSAGTYSYFSDRDTAPDQTVTAGTLQLAVGGSGVSSPMHFTNVEPGWVGESRTFTYHNNGTLDGRLRIRILPDASNSATCNQAVNIQGDGFDKAPQLNTKETLAQAYQYTKNGSWVADMYGGKSTGDGNGRYKSVPFIVSVDSVTGNALQGQQCGFKIQADLVQLGNGADGNQAKFPAAPA
jgi:predicted ribosomally synthesized peptide with SipW-like signal peptide